MSAERDGDTIHHVVKEGRMRFPMQAQSTPKEYQSCRAPQPEDYASPTYALVLKRPSCGTYFAEIIRGRITRARYYGESTWRSDLTGSAMKRIIDNTDQAVAISCAADLRDWSPVQIGRVSGIA